MSAPWVDAEAMVVSDTGEMLSPKVAPPITAPMRMTGSVTESGRRRVEQRGAENHRAQTGSGGRRDEAADEKCGDGETAAADAARLRRKDQGVDKAAGVDQARQDTGQQPGQDHQQHDGLAHPANHGVGPFRAVDGEQHRQRRGPPSESARNPAHRAPPKDRATPLRRERAQRGRGCPRRHHGNTDDFRVLIGFVQVVTIPEHRPA